MPGDSGKSTLIGDLYQTRASVQAAHTALRKNLRDWQRLSTLLAVARIPQKRSRIEPGRATRENTGYRAFRNMLETGDCGLVELFRIHVQ